MAYLAVVGSKAVNGVAAIHSEIIKDTIFKVPSHSALFRQCMLLAISPAHLSKGPEMHLPVVVSAIPHNGSSRTASVRPDEVKVNLACHQRKLTRG